MTADHAALRDQFTAALRALDVATVLDPTLDPEAAALVLAGGVAFRLADRTTEAAEAEGADTTTIRTRFARGWNDVCDAAACDASGEAVLLSVFTDLIGAAVHDNAVKSQSPYAKAASFALQAAAALLYLATEADPDNPVEPVSRAGAHRTADDRLTHAHAWLAHHGSTS